MDTDASATVHTKNTTEISGGLVAEGSASSDVDNTTGEQTITTRATVMGFGVENSKSSNGAQETRKGYFTGVGASPLVFGVEVNLFVGWVTGNK
jgi:hypothetical protein